MPIKKEVIIGDCRLILGDCLEVMPTLGKVDAILTDPPYELSSASPGNSHFGMSLSKFESDAYKNIVSGFDMDATFTQLEVLCKPFNMFCFCSNKQISGLMAYHEKRKRSTTLLIWHKINAAPFANGVWRGDIEYCIHTKDKGAVFVGNAVEKKKVTELPLVIDKAHPTVKPLPLIIKYMKICSNLEQTILDPFMGSGTTLVACAKMGRKGIGIEIDEDYFNIACKRVEEAYKQPDFLIEQPKKKPEQGNLIAL